MVFMPRLPTCILTAQVDQINHKSTAESFSWQIPHRWLGLSNFALQFPFDQGADFLHAPSIDAKVAIAGPGG